MVEAKEHVGLDELCLNGGGNYGHYRLAGEDGSSLGNCVYVTGEAEITEVLKERLGEELFASEVGDILLGKLKLFNVVDNLLKTCGDSKSATVGHLAVEYVEVRYFISLAELEVAVGHSELVKITKKRVIHVRHCRSPFRSSKVKS